MRSYHLQSVFLVAIVSCLISCSPIDDQEKKFTGTWKFCTKGDDFPDPIIDYAETTDLVLNESGEWTFGGSSGKWGTKEEVENFSFDNNNFDLGFSETEMIVSNHSNQYEGTSAYIDMIEGIEILVLDIKYSYEQNNLYQNSYGEVDNNVSQETSDILYYFVRSEDINGLNKIKNYFEENKKKAIANRHLSDNPTDPFAYIQTDSFRLSNIFIALEYNRSKEKLTNTNQKIALAFLYALKKQKENYNQVLSTIPNDEYSRFRDRLIFLVAFLDGKRDFTLEEYKEHGSYLSLLTNSVLNQGGDIAFFEKEINTLKTAMYEKEFGH